MEAKLQSGNRGLTTRAVAEVSGRVGMYRESRVDRLGLQRPEFLKGTPTSEVLATTAPAGSIILASSGIAKFGRWDW